MLFSRKSEIKNLLRQAEEDEMACEVILYPPLTPPDMPDMYRWDYAERPHPQVRPSDPIKLEGRLPARPLPFLKSLTLEEKLKEDAKWSFNFLSFKPEEKLKPQEKSSITPSSKLEEKIKPDEQFPFTLLPSSKTEGKLNFDQQFPSTLLPSSKTEGKLNFDEKSFTPLPSSKILTPKKDLPKSSDKKKVGDLTAKEKFIGTFEKLSDYVQFKTHHTVRDQLADNIRFRPLDGKIQALIEVDHRTRAPTIERPVFKPRETSFLKSAEDSEWKDLFESELFEVEEDYGEENREKMALNLAIKQASKRKKKDNINYELNLKRQQDKENNRPTTLKKIKKYHFEADQEEEKD